MQCINCGFENIPGMDVCVHCQSRMVLGDVAVVPPRASWVHSPTRWRQAWYRSRLGLKRIADAFRSRWVTNWSTDVPDAVMGSVIPGLGLIRKGIGLLGWPLLIVWSAVLLATLASIGTLSYVFWISGLATIHAVGIVAAMRPLLRFEGVFWRAGFGVFCFLIVRFGAYGAVEWVGSGLYVPLPLQGVISTQVLRNGDGILYDGRWLRPDSFQRGDLVVFRIRGADIRTGGTYWYVIPDGLAVDRIVGVPGDRVELVNGSVLVNGEPAASYAYPLGSLRQYGNVSVTLGPVEYAIFPSTVPFAVHGYVPVGSLVEILAHVHSDDILGRVVFRLHPWSNIGRVE